MSELKVDFFYGIYPSSVHGNLFLIDPLLPPKKCPLHCATCPLITNLEPRETKKVDLDAPIMNIMNSIKKHLPFETKINGFLLWGYGDPLLLGNIYELLIALRALLIEHGLQVKIYVHSSLIPLVESCSQENSKCTIMKSVVEQVDGFITPFLWYSVDKYMLGWPQETSLTHYAGAIRRVFENNYGKLNIELHAFKLHEHLYPELHDLEEVVIVLKHMRSKSIVVKPIDRPTVNQYLKPTPESHVARIVDYLENEGFKTRVEKFNPPQNIPWKEPSNILYNYTLRIPLKYSEIRSLFSEIGLIALDNLVTKKYITKTTWAGEVFFVGNLR